MSIGKYCKVGGVIKEIVGEYVKVGGAIKEVTINCMKIDDVIEDIELAARFIYATEQTSERCYCITNAGAQEWVHYETGLVDPQAVAVDNHAYSYWACANNVYKLDPDGALVWKFTGHGCPVKSIAVDIDGNVYSGDFCGVVKKLDENGVELWSKSLGVNYSVYAICVDHSAGMVYAGTGWAYDAVYRLLVSNGNFAKIYTAGADVTGIATDEGGYVYFGQNNGLLRKISAGGAPQWDVNKGGGITQIVIGHDGWGYCSTGTGRSLKQFKRSDGTDGWTYDPGGTACAEGCSVDRGGNAYGAYRKTGNSAENVIRKIDKTGAWEWSWSPYVSAQFFGLAVTPGLKAAGFG